MDKNEARIECKRLFGTKTLEDSLDLLEIYLKFFFNVIQKHHHEEVYSYANRDAKMILQMMFTKTAHVKRVLSGIEFYSEEGVTLNKIIDPTTVAVFIRNIYETVAMFNLIYRRTKSEDEKLILYNLWVHSGLKYRQRFEVVATTQQSKEKVDNEKKQIKQLISEIENTELYKNLDEKDKNKIQTKIKEKDYKICFNKGKVKFLSWQEITTEMEFKNDLLDNIYAYFSLYSHPSNVAVFQFSEMFDKGEEPFKDITNFNLRNMFILLSIFTADYINLFPNVLTTFNSLSIIDQIVIDFHNGLMRGDDFKINEAWKELE